jgi:hypothetical protein
LNIIDEFAQECMAVLASRKIKNQDMIYILFDLSIFCGILEYIRSDKGMEFTAKAI